MAIIDRTPSASPVEREIPKWQETRVESDTDGYLYDAGFRQMCKRWGKLQGSGQLDAETMRALIIAGKILYQSFEEALADHGITHQQFRTMTWIDGSGPEGTQLHEIASWLGVTPRNVTGLVDGLEAQGLAERVADPSDRRAVIARLTPAGRAKLEIAKAIHSRRQKEIFGRLSEAEKLQLRHISLKVIQASKAFWGRERLDNG